MITFLSRIINDRRGCFLGSYYQIDQDMQIFKDNESIENRITDETIEMICRCLPNGIEFRYAVDDWID